MPFLNLLHQNRICIGTKPAFSFWINISTVSEVRCGCQGLGLVARIEASILVFDTMQVLYWPVLRQNQYCSFNRRCKTCLDTKPVLYQDKFCSWTDRAVHRAAWSQLECVYYISSFSQNLPAHVDTKLSMGQGSPITGSQCMWHCLCSDLSLLVWGKIQYSSLVIRTRTHVYIFPPQN